MVKVKAIHVYSLGIFNTIKSQQTPVKLYGGLVGYDSAATHYWLFIAICSVHLVLSIMFIPEQLLSLRKNVMIPRARSALSGANHVAPRTEMRHAVSAP